MIGSDSADFLKPAKAEFFVAMDRSPLLAMFAAAVQGSIFRYFIIESKEKWGGFWFVSVIWVSNDMMITCVDDFDQISS